MRVFAHNPKLTQQTNVAAASSPGKLHSGLRCETSSTFHSPRTISTGTKQEAVPEPQPAPSRATRIAHDFGRLPIYRKQLDEARSDIAVNTPGDSYEREADRVAADVMRVSEPRLQRACVLGAACPKCSEGRHSQEGTRLQASRIQANAPEPPVPSLGSPVHEVLRTPGQPLDAATRAFMEPRFGHDFGRVRVHVGARAAESADALRARAYTLGNRIVFGARQYAPTTPSGRLLIAHELTHVLQQGSTPRPMRQTDPAAHEEDEDKPRAEGLEVGGGAGGTAVRVLERGGVRISRDLAIAPTKPDAPEPVLSEQQIQQAIRYNAFRFKDPYSIAIVRDIVGVPRFPAISDEELALGVARYQAAFGLTPDGRAGPDTTGRLVSEARAENLPKDANQLRADNFVTWAPAAGTHNGCGAAPDASGLATFFQWDVNFSTSLRNGWIVQEIVNTRARTTCGGGAIAETLTPHYWEAWWVDGAGNVRVPTAINAARTRATASVATAPADDLWRRAAAAPSRGNWAMTGRLFTCLRLPAGFAAGNVPDALALPSTAAAPNADDLGLVAARRRAAGQWNCCGPAATHFHTP
jgi:Domain of unknown function (DUF4157)